MYLMSDIANLLDTPIGHDWPLLSGFLSDLKGKCEDPQQQAFMGTARECPGKMHGTSRGLTQRLFSVTWPHGLQ